LQKTTINLMSSILYYSNFCEPCKKMLQIITKTKNDDMHFICIDNRVQQNGKTYIILQNQQRIIMPENVTRVPALLLLNQNYKVLYGDDIYAHLRPQQTQQTKVATKNNMEPVTFQDGFSTFGGFSSGIVSDSYSFLDQSDTELRVSGNGGLRQMHNYVTLSESMNVSMNLPQDDHDYKSNKMKEGDVSIEALERRRKEELDGLNNNRR
jgi:hypothetical protein